MKPILFNTEMVRAILDGRKTVTRRAIKGIVEPSEWNAVNNCKESEYGSDVDCYLVRKKATEERGIHYPRFQTGDILYIRETFCYGRDTHKTSFEPEPYDKDILYKADFKHALDRDIIRWKPSIHMPKEAARVFLKVTDIRIERLQDISEDSAVAEGFSPVSWLSARDLFANTWQYIYLSWDTNPWVWVIEFIKQELTP